MASGKTMQAIISLVGKIDPSLEKAIQGVEKKLSGLSKMKGAASVASKVGSTIAKGVAVAGGAVASATAAAGTAALQSYSQYEQLVGGIETLFGAGGKSVEEYAQSVGKNVSEAQAEYDVLMASQKAVFDNASQAYKTAGVSANTYMEQATNFSASLIQSLGGDTQAAAQYADLAIRDMSDNANKMGTDISSIQQTYQSLMRGNYAMLDNLKLGYGGTKTELERLVADASELTGQALDPSKFSDVITAIHAVQDNLGITGTTALEAATTIEGSVNTAKAAWSNWLTGLGTEGADMGALTDQLLESIGNVANNVGPVVQRIASSLANSLPGALSGALSSVGPVLAQALAGVLNPTGGALGLDLGIDAGGIISTVQSIAGALGPVVQGIGSVFQQIFPAIQSGISGLVSSVGPAVQILSTSLGPALSNLATSVMPPLMSAISGILPLLASIANAILPPIINFLTPIISLVMQIASAVIPPLTAAIQALTPVIQFIISAVMTLSSVFSGVSGIISIVQGGITGLIAPITSAISSFQSFMSAGSGLSGVMSAIGAAISGVCGFISNLIGLAGQAASAIASIGGGILGGIGSFLGFARGGFTNGPYVAGEDPRYPNEAVISFNPAYREQNVRYWQMAGHMLGAYSASAAPVTAAASAGGGTVIDMSGMTFSPRVEVRGNASRDDIVAAIRQCEGEFLDFVEGALARRAEVAYA